MIDQTSFYDGTPGTGNCTEACIASLLGIPLDEVGKFRPANDDFWADFYRFFEGRGLKPARVKVKE